MTDIATIIEYIEWRNKKESPDDFAGFIHEALSFSNTEARELISLLSDLDKDTCGVVCDILADKLKETYGDSAAEWKRQQNQLLSDAIAKDIARGTSND